MATNWTAADFEAAADLIGRIGNLVDDSHFATIVKITSEECASKGEIT
jgi:hypothetical protein